MKVSELEGATLDRWVACALLQLMIGKPINDQMRGEIVETIADLPFTPSSNWAIAGPLIERDRIHLTFEPSDNSVWMGERHGPHWIAYQRGCPTQIGPTPLIAAMRCFVESKFGKEVTDE